MHCTLRAARLPVVATHCHTLSAAAGSPLRTHSLLPPVCHCFAPFVVTHTCALSPHTRCHLTLALPPHTRCQLTLAAVSHSLLSHPAAVSRLLLLLFCCCLTPGAAIRPRLSYGCCHTTLALLPHYCCLKLLFLQNACWSHTLNCLHELAAAMNLSLLAAVCVRTRASQSGPGMLLDTTAVASSSHVQCPRRTCRT